MAARITAAHGAGRAAPGVLGANLNIGAVSQPGGGYELRRLHPSSRRLPEAAEGEAGAQLRSG